MTTAVAYFTRADYMASKADEQTASHHRYYSQFCSPAVLSAVSSSIGADKIKASTDLHFNDIQLARWDRLEPSIRNLCIGKMADINGAVSVDAYGRRSCPWSLGDAVCIAKAAARIIKG